MLLGGVGLGGAKDKASSPQGVVPDPQSQLARVNDPVRTVSLPQDNLTLVQIGAIVPDRTLRLCGHTESISKINGLSIHQRMVFDHLCGMVKGGLLVERPFDPTANAAVAFNWNEETWIRVILGLVKSLENKPRTANDCWLSGNKLSQGYPTVHVTPGGWSSAKGQGRRFYSFDNVPEVRVTVGKLGWAIGHPEVLLGHTSGSRETQADHLCEANRCFNPWHLHSATDQDNKSRHFCRFGARFLCPHLVKCVYTNLKTGLSIPCRNLDTATALGSCSCVPSCMDLTARIG